jgi:hypothetical protein
MRMRYISSVENFGLERTIPKKEKKEKKRKREKERESYLKKIIFLRCNHGILLIHVDPTAPIDKDSWCIVA